MSRLGFLARPSVIALSITMMAILLSIRPARRFIEQSMVWHMGIQMPLLVLGGWFAMQAMANSRLVRSIAVWNHFGLTGFIIALGIFSYWMLPLAIDRAVVLPEADIMKLVTLFVSGMLLNHSKARSPVVMQLFFVGYQASMLVLLGIYFVTTDLRLCNAYSIESQIDAGYGVAGLGIALGCFWLINISRQG